MASACALPALDPRRIASQSRPVIGGLLRDRLGYRGVVITDSIEAQAVLDRSHVATKDLCSGTGIYHGRRKRMPWAHAAKPSLRN